MHRLAVAAAITCLCAPALFACSKDPPAPGPTTAPTRSTSPSPSNASPSPSTSSTPSAAPVIPALAMRKSIPGAKAFVAVFVVGDEQGMDVSRNNLVTNALPIDCVSCRDVANGIDRIRRRSGKTEGAIWSIRSAAPIPLQNLSAPIIHTAIRLRPVGGPPPRHPHGARIPAGTTQWDFHLAWTKDHSAREQGGLGMKRMTGTLLCMFLLTWLAFTVAPASAADGCNVVKHSGDPRHYWSNCHDGDSHSGAGPLGPKGGGGDGRYYEYVWLPTCPNAFPGTPGAELAELPSCPHVQQSKAHLPIPLGPIVRPRRTCSSAWRYLTSDCRDPEKVGPTKKRALSVGRCAVSNQANRGSTRYLRGPDYTLVNLRTTFYTRASV